MTELNLSEERDFGGVINASFSFIGQEFSMLIKALLTYTAIPILAVIGIFAYIGHFLNNGGIDALTNSPDVTTVFSLLIPFMILIFLVQISQIIVVAVTNSYLKAYKDFGKANFTIQDVGKHVGRKFFPIIGYSILISILVMAGFMFFIIPGIYIAVCFSFVFAIMFIEDNGLNRNFNRCFKLIKNNWWVTFGLVIVASMIVGIVVQVINIPTQVYLQTKMITITQTGDFSQFPFGIIIIVYILLVVFGTYLNSFVHIVLGIHYFSLNEKLGTGFNSIMDKINQISTTDENGAENK